VGQSLGRVLNELMRLREAHQEAPPGENLAGCEPEGDDRER
jgi:hypothetical protein